MSGDPSNEPVWLVTGASRGIGAAIAARAHNQGCRVVVVARGEEALRTADKMGAGALGIQADVSDVAAAEGAIEKTMQKQCRSKVCRKTDQCSWKNVTFSTHLAQTILTH